MVCDPASLEVVRRKRKVKTDRIDARRMVRALRAWDGGDRDAMSRVHVPTVAEEDGRRLPPRRERLVRERRRLSNAVDGLLRLHGLSGVNPARPGFRERLGGMETGYGGPLPPELLAGTGGILDRLELVCAEMKVAGARKMEMPGRRAGPCGASTRTPPGRRWRLGGLPPPRLPGRRPPIRKEPPGRRGPARPPTGRGRPRRPPTTRRCWSGCAGIGPNDALMLGGELFYREFRNRRRLASLAGLAPVPFASGGVDNDQGISKAGSAMLRRHLVQMAWRWLRHQPDSALSAWFRDYVSARDGRSRRRGIVALARKLPVAPLRFATTGLVPEGAVLSQA